MEKKELKIRQKSKRTYKIAESCIEMSEIALNATSVSDLFKSPLEDIVLTQKTGLFSQTGTVLVDQSLGS